MDIVVWLRSLGLGKYEAIFRENGIDETVLPSLTHENLKELGVASFGHRVKLLDAIAALRSDAGGKTASIDAATPSGTPSPHPEDRAERARADQIADDHKSRCDADTRLEGCAGLQITAAINSSPARTALSASSSWAWG
jgi:SAM domain (Sterile alpha motif)